MAKTMNQNDNPLNRSGHFWSALQTMRAGHEIRPQVASYDLEVLSSAFEDSRRPNVADLPQSIHSSSNQVQSSHSGSTHPENVPPSSSNSYSVAQGSSNYTGGSQRSLAHFSAASHLQASKKKKRGSGVACRPPQGASSSLKKKKRSFRINIEDLMMKDSAFQQNNARWQIERLKYRLGAQAQQAVPHVNSQTALDLSISSSQLVKIQEQFDKTSSEEGCSFRNQMSMLNNSRTGERKTMHLQASQEQKSLQQMAKLQADAVPQSVSQISEELPAVGRQQTDRNSVSLQIVNGTIVTLGERSSSHHASQQSQMLSIRGRKFKRKSDFQSESTLNQILEQKSRISVNGSSTGKVEIKVSPSAANVLNRSSYLHKLQLQKRQQHDVQVNQFEGKPSLNYSLTSNQIVEVKDCSEYFEMQKSTKRAINNQTVGNNLLEELFENVEDYIDEQEECGSEQKAIRFSIRCLDFQMMMPEATDRQPQIYVERFDQTLADQQEQPLMLQNQEGRQSLLSRASSILMRTSLQKKFNLTSTQALPLQLQISVPMSTLLPHHPICTPQNQPTKKILPDSKSLPATSSSQINMTNIDEKEEIVSEQQQKLMSPGESSRNVYGQDGGRAVAEGKPSRVTNGVHQCSNLGNYNMQTFFTPSQASKKNANSHNFELLNASCNVFDKQKGQSAVVAKRTQPTANKDEKVNSPSGSALNGCPAKMMPMRSKSQHSAQSNFSVRQQAQFQPAESKEKDTTVVIDEEEEPEEDQHQVAAVASADNKSKFNFSSIAYHDKEKSGGKTDVANTGPTMSNSKSPWQTTATMSKNKLNEKVKCFLAPKMQGTAEFCSNDKRNLSQRKYEYVLLEDRDQDDDEQVFQASGEYKNQNATPKVSQFYGRRSMTSNELLSSAYKFNAAAHEEAARSRVVIQQSLGDNQSPRRQSKTSGKQSHRSPTKSVRSDQSFELKNLSHFREARERQQEHYERQREYSEVQITPLTKHVMQNRSPCAFQLTPIKHQLENSQEAVSPQTSSNLPPRQNASALKSTTGKKISKSTRKQRKTAKKKTVNLSISDLEQMMKAESDAKPASCAKDDSQDVENENHRTPHLVQDEPGTDQDKKDVQRGYPNLLSNKQRKDLAATDFEQWSQGQRDQSKKRQIGNGSNVLSSDKTTGKGGPYDRDEPLINKQLTSVVTQFEEIDALKMKKIDSEKEPKHKSNLLDDSLSANTKEENILQQFVTKVPKYQSTMEDQSSLSANSKPMSKSSQDMHHQHFMQTIQQLKFIKQHIRMVPESEVEPHYVELPPPRDPENQKKLLIFDMDETLIHCVDDVEKQDSDIVLEIKFPDADEDETVYAGINIRPYIIDCLKEASKHYQVIVFTASHKVYADAILDFIDPDGSLIQHRLYRHNCILTKPEPASSSSSHSLGSGFYIKDLRIFEPSIFSLKDIVIVDNSVYSFAFHIDNGVPIVPFYDDKDDEEMLHLIYYLNCLAQVDDVREQNRQAFELRELAEASSTQEEEQRGDFSSEQVYERIEECHQNQEETQSEEEEEEMMVGSDVPIATSANQDLNIQKNVQSFGPKDVQREYDSMGVLAGNEVPAQAQEAPEEDEDGLTANFELKAHRVETEVERAKRLREESAYRSLRNIYQNLIDEDDIIIEEESKEAISASKTNTASISEIQILKHHSNYSNNTGQEFKKLVKLIRNNSFSSQQIKDSQSCSQDKLDKFSLTAQSACQKIMDCNTCSAKDKDARRGQNACAHHGGLSARGGDSRNEEVILTFRTRSNNDQLIGSPQNIHQASSFGSFVMQAASAQEENWCNHTMMNPGAELYLKQIAQTTPCRSKELRVLPNSAAPVVKADQECDTPPVREYKECRQQWPLRASRKHLDVNVVQMSINLEEDKDENNRELDQYFKSLQEDEGEFAVTLEDKRLQKALKTEQMARRVHRVHVSESVDDVEIQREARKPADMLTPSSRVGSPLPLAQSQSRSNCMMSPKSSIRSRRSRRNRVASRLIRDESGRQDVTLLQTSSPSGGSLGHTMPHDDSIQDASQYCQLLQNRQIQHQQPLPQNHSRRLAHTSLGFIATRIDQLKESLSQNIGQQAESPSLVSFHGHQPIQSPNQSSPEQQISPKPDL